MEDQGAAPALPLPPGRGRRLETYIVQLPKDQVYRVPPRENALMVEQYRNPATPQKRRACCWNRRLLLTAALVLVAVIAVIGITLATLYFIFNPTGPSFTVSHVAFKRGNGRNTPPQYEVSLMAKNPNQKLSIHYEDGVVLLFFQDAKVASGRFPTLEQRRDEESDVNIELTRSSGALPRDMNGGTSPVDLKLLMKLRVRITTMGIQSWLMRSYVACDFKISGLRPHSHVLSQACHSKFKQY
ncbi:hypothetical protein VNO78_10722 [Psophocarpus tetragonolobus]|uniref:Late embryogenesis abundant protein LEA-2 subgroup domain-containing protein n=1 Tax=Psophocarpus tetragonolobus TaxID=3891 RepID=A0AAN9SKI8_PSOTE